MKRRYIVFFLTAIIVGIASLITMPQTMAVMRLTNKTIIVIDPGHGGFDGGATGRYTKIKEDELNLAVSMKLKKLFEQNGYKVVMTRKDDKALGHTKDEDMAARKNIIESADADIVISVHMNKFEDSSVAGPMAFYYESSEEGKLLASLIQEELNDKLKPLRPRTYKPETYFILRSGECPCVLIECGFLSNEREERLLQTEEYQKDCANAIYLGVKKYLSFQQADINENLNQ